MNNTVLETLLGPDLLKITGYHVALNFCRSSFFFAICKKKFPQNKITAHFFHKNLLHCRNYIQKYWFEGENAEDNLVDNTSNGTLTSYCQSNVVA